VVARPTASWDQELCYDPRTTGLGIQWLLGERTLKTVQRKAVQKGLTHPQTEWPSAAHHALGHSPYSRRHAKLKIELIARRWFGSPGGVSKR
jgi:hypothetical protein